MKITEYSFCKCGAMTVYTDDGKSFSCRQENMPRFFPHLDLAAIRQAPTTFSCDHCINHYGLDLCACGSGAPYENCDGGFNCCGMPMQSLTKGYTCVRTNDAFGDIRPSEVLVSDLTADLDENKKETAKKGLAFSVQRAIATLRQAQAFMEELKDNIVDTIRRTPFEGVAETSSSPICFTLNLSTLLKQPGKIMAAEYYSPACQADLVEKALDMSSGNILSLMNKVSSMVEKRCVVIAKFSYQLNDTTLDILRSVLEDAGWSEMGNTIQENIK